MLKSEGSLKLENDTSSSSPPQSDDTKSESKENNSSPPPPPLNSNSDSDSSSNSSPSTDDSSNRNPSPSPDQSPPSPSPPPPPSNKSLPPTESPLELPPSSPPPPPKKQSPPPPSPSKKEPPLSPSPPPPQEESPPTSPPPSPKQQSTPPPPSDSSSPPLPSSPSSTPTPPPPTSSKTLKSRTISPPSKNTSTKSSPGSSPPALVPSTQQSSSNVSRASSPSGGGSMTETQANKTVTNSVYGVMINVAVAGALFAAVFIALFFFLKRRRKRKQQALTGNYTPPPGNIEVKSDSPGKGSPMVYYSPESGIRAGSKTHFRYEELMEMTDGFTHDNIIGEGGFGWVYKGRLPDGNLVAVKRLKVGSGQGDQEFKAEVEIISRIHHRHLVSLVGYCIAENQRLLIYDFVGNKTLEHHLHGKDMPVLEWSKRVKIAIGAAKGLAYLHEDCQPRIIHRDIKSANILLEYDFEARVADFGLARLNDTSQTHVSTRVMGTFGYLAPEYASSGKLTDRSDVFSFGVVLLELITGLKPVDPARPLGDESLVEWARPRLLQTLENGDYSELIDPRLEKRYVESEVLTMIEAAAACVRHAAAKRPRMSLVVRALDFEGTDLSNGVKVGQSTTYDSSKYSDEISIFRRTAFGSDYGSEFDNFSEDFSSRELSYGHTSWKSEYSSGEFMSGESEVQPFRKSGAFSDGVRSGNYGGGRFK
ncbi:Proline-rich receptor-like protein kinase PERK13 [Hibiscus syriacus]|uniref:non-specific serine/threonine protein kinase n=1 Tax=Hibiscus syriacus TaxID=106335 RepID=A0A6A2Y036_HIBSY|nr:proline-rich receptor-like protein kinase PERK13 [Hibiscus syriacus]KAE8664669.1 Proline-rich receptor-like protein kinase PERK13 [Hibiscus syriacus]